jgi:hypothetical protein
VTLFVFPWFVVCVVPSIVVPAQVTAGKAVAGVMTATPPVRRPVATLKAIVWDAPVQFCASVSASRREPAPVSAVFVTVKVVAVAGAAARTQDRTARLPRGKTRREVRARTLTSLILARV